MASTSDELSADSLPFARNYQLEALEKAIKQNTIVFLETGSGKTLIAIMLLRSHAYLLRKPSPFIAVFLVPQVVLISQQAEAVKMHTDLRVGMYWGEMGVDFWNAHIWKEEVEKHEVFVMTPAILLDGLRHSFFNLSMIKIIVFDECHHARGKHPYSCIMKEFYHPQLHLANSVLPKIFGMTASPIKSKAGRSEESIWAKIHDLETLLHSKVFTCVSESVLAEFISFPTPIFKFYQLNGICNALYDCLVESLNHLWKKHENLLKCSNLQDDMEESARIKLSKAFSVLLFCLNELGIWLALKAAEYMSHGHTDDLFFSFKKRGFNEAFAKGFNTDVIQAIMCHVPTGSEWSICDNLRANVNAGLISTKVYCLIECLLEYRNLEDMRCIIFVERIITTIVLNKLLNELLPKHNMWKSKYIAGNGLQSQTRKMQNAIVEQFRKGELNIIVATSILEEGLDVQSCNLVIRFDPSATVCSFIQSRGRARMHNSEYVLMVDRSDFLTHSRLEKYLTCGDLMRKESLQHAETPCMPLENDLNSEEYYCVLKTGAIVTLASSVSLLYFYCSRLPSDCYFKPSPRWDVDTCTLHLPNSSPLQRVVIQKDGDSKLLKKIACLEACKQLHQMGALTDHLVPDIVVEEAVAAENRSTTYIDDQPVYVPHQLVNQFLENSPVTYYCYVIGLEKDFPCDIPVHDVVLLVRRELDFEDDSMHFDLKIDEGSLNVQFKFMGILHLNCDQVLLCRRFQITIFRILLDRNLSKLKEILNKCSLGNELEMDFLLLPSSREHEKFSIIDWKYVTCILYKNLHEYHIDCSGAKLEHTIDGAVCRCLLRNSLIYTPHNGKVYCIFGFLELNGKSILTKRDGETITYADHYQKRYGIQLLFERQQLLHGRHLFRVRNFLHSCSKQNEEEIRSSYVELPPELCSVIMAPISISTFYSFSFLPSIMYRLESLLVAINLRRIHLDCCIQKTIPTLKVLEAITTKRCQESFHLESLEVLGDSFLKYAVGQHLFKNYQDLHEGLLSLRKDKIVSNAALCKFGCEHGLVGFIRCESFDPNSWIIPGDKSTIYQFNEVSHYNSKIHVYRSRRMKTKTVADVVEALIGAFLFTSGELAAMSFMNHIGIPVNFNVIPYSRHFPVSGETLVNVGHLESLLNYTFSDPSLLIEALTHGSYMLPEIPRCYQRLEFLGDSVLDYLITMHFYIEYPGLTPDMLTDMRSASANNDCYARSAIKHALHKHILHASNDLHKHIADTIINFSKISSESTFGWEFEETFPKVLGDVIEALAGAIFVDSGYNKEAVFKSIRPLLEPLVTPETLVIHPARKLNEVCQKNHYEMREPIISLDNGMTLVTIEVLARGVSHKRTAAAADKRTAKKVACKNVLDDMKKTFLFE